MTKLSTIKLNPIAKTTAAPTPTSPTEAGGAHPSGTGAGAGGAHPPPVSSIMCGPTVLHFLAYQAEGVDKGLLELSSAWESLWLTTAIPYQQVRVVRIMMTDQYVYEYMSDTVWSEFIWHIILLINIHIVHTLLLLFYLTPLHSTTPPLYNTSATDGDGHQAAGAAAEPGQGGGDCRGGHSVGAEGTGDGGTTEKKVRACVYSVCVCLIILHMYNCTILYCAMYIL